MNEKVNDIERIIARGEEVDAIKEETLHIWDAHFQANGASSQKAHDAANAAQAAAVAEILLRRRNQQGTDKGQEVREWIDVLAEGRTLTSRLGWDNNVAPTEAEWWRNQAEIQFAEVERLRSAVAGYEFNLQTGVIMDTEKALEYRSILEKELQRVIEEQQTPQQSFGGDAVPYWKGFEDGIKLAIEKLNIR